MDVQINTICSTLLLLCITGLLCSSISTSAPDTKPDSQKSQQGQPDQPEHDLKYSSDEIDEKGDEDVMSDNEEEDEEEEEIENLSKSTATPATTVRTTPHAVVEDGDFVVRSGDRVCVRVALKATFTVKYASVRSDKKKYYDAVINLPQTVSVSGVCEHNKSSISISWSNNSYTLNIQFGTVPGGRSRRDLSTKLPGWSATSITFSFNTKDDTHFQNPLNAGKHTVQSASGKRYFTAERNQSYACKSKDELTLQEYRKNHTLNTEDISRVQVHIWNTHVQGFDVPPSGKFSQTLTCEADVISSLPKRKVVPIIVAACLAGLIVIIIVAYFISKNVGHSAYRPMA